MTAYASKELRFTLLGIVDNLQNNYKKEKQMIDNINAGGSLMETDDNHHNNLKNKIENMTPEQREQRLSELSSLISDEKEKFIKWKV